MQASKLEIASLSAQQLTKSLIVSSDSTVLLTQSSILNSNLSQALLDISESVFSAEHSSFTQIAGQQTIIQATDSDSLTIENCTFSSIKESQGIKVESSKLRVSGSLFELLSATEGGAILVEKSNATVQNSEFRQNNANKGGAISFKDCNNDETCQLNIDNSVFDSNEASDSGGAIYYNLYQPTSDRNTFYNNNALYGNDFASYPTRLEIIGGNTRTNLVSGQRYTESIKVRLLDGDGNLMDADNSSIVEIQIVQSSTSLSGTTLVPFVNGEASFNDLVFTAEPERQNVPFQIRCASIDNQIVSRVQGLSESSSFNSTHSSLTVQPKR